MTDDHETNLKTLKESTSWMKGKLVIYSIKRQQDDLCGKTKLKHQEKLDSLLINKRINEGIHLNPKYNYYKFS